MTINIHELLDGKWEDGTRPKDIYASYVSKRPSAYVAAIMEGLSAGSRRVQNGCAELASLLSEESPELLHPHLDVFVNGLAAKAKVIRWEAVCTVGNLARVDQNEIPKLVPSLIPLLRDESIVLQGHTVRALAKIATAHPKRARAIFRALTAVTDLFPGNKIGFLIEAMAAFSKDKSLRAEVKAFVTPFIASDIKVVAKKATRISKQL